MLPPPADAVYHSADIAPGPGMEALIAGTARPSAAQKGQSFDLDAAIKSKMENAFGDLSDVKFYKSQAVGDAGAEAIAQGNEIAFAPGKADFTTRSGQERLGHELSHVMSQRSGAVRGTGFINNASLEARADREGAMAASGQQICARPVSHALSGVAPSPFMAGAMQAKRYGEAPTTMLPLNDLPLNDLEDPRVPSLEAPRSKYAKDYDVLNSQAGTDEERRLAYNNIAEPTANNMTEDQRVAISGYIGGSEPINTFLRGQTNSSNYPLPKDIPRIKKQAKDISAALKNNPLQENVSAYKGITDKYLAMMFEQHGLKDALNTDGTVNHKWLRNNQKMMLDTLVGKTFHDKGYTSTTTETSFAKGWATQKSAMEIMERTKSKKKRAKILQTLNNHPEQIPGVHMIKMNLPKGANASFIDRAVPSESHPVEQREILVDQGSTFKISDIRKMEGSDTYELVMDMLAEEKGKKRKKK